MVTGRARWLLCLFFLMATLLAACANRGTEPAGNAPPRTVALDRSDQGTTTSLSVGDHLVLDLGTVPNGTWRLTTYPRDALALVTSDAGRGRFEFRAEAVGAGRVIVSTRPDCGPTETVPCRTPDPQEPVDAVPGLYPPKPFEVAVEIS